MTDNIPCLNLKKPIALIILEDFKTKKYYLEV